MWTISCYEFVTWLSDCVHYSLRVWLWLWLWLCWMDQNSGSEWSIGLAITFRNIYWTVFYVPTYILDGVWRFYTLTVWVWVQTENHVRLLHLYLPLVDVRKLYISSKMIIELGIMYMCVYIIVINCLYCADWSSHVILRVHSGFVYWYCNYFFCVH